MNWIMENLDAISAVGIPILSFIIGWALKLVKNKKYQATLLNLVQLVEKKMIEADYCGNTDVVHNDDVKDQMEKIKIELGAGK